MMMFAQAGLLTGSTAGLAFVLHYATGWPFGLVFFAINIPFYWFAWTRVGRTFTVKTRSEEHTSELQSQSNLVCRLLLEKKKNNSVQRSLLHRRDRSQHTTTYFLF